tara:strand:+ start:395 stop:541 length:147 start_codon:yes stop_codon:yes gene_type:complete
MNRYDGLFGLCLMGSILSYAWGIEQLGWFLLLVSSVLFFSALIATINE